MCRQKNLKDITISIKGFNEKSFEKFSDEKAFAEFCSAIENLREKRLCIRANYNCTEILSQSMISDFVHFLRYYGLHEIVLHDIRPYVTESDEIIKENSAEPLQVIAQELEKAGIVSYIRLNQPFCRYDSNFLKQFMNSKRVMSTCAVKKQQGIFVDPDLNIILCNELRHIVMGNYQKDFWDYGSMIEVYRKPDIISLYNKLAGCPMQKCIKCDMWEKCGGNPEMILPAEYMEHVFRRMNERNRELYFNNEEFVEELIHYINSVIIQMEMMPKNSAILSLLQLFNLEELISITIQNTRRKGYKQKYMAMRDLERRYVAVLNDKRGDITNRDVMSTTVIRKNNLEEEDR